MTTATVFTATSGSKSVTLNHLPDGSWEGTIENQDSITWSSTLPDTLENMIKSGKYLFRNEIQIFIVGTYGLGSGKLPLQATVSILDSGNTPYARTYASTEDSKAARGLLYNSGTKQATFEHTDKFPFLTMMTWPPTTLTVVPETKDAGPLSITSISMIYHMTLKQASHVSGASSDWLYISIGLGVIIVIMIVLIIIMMIRRPHSQK